MMKPGAIREWAVKAFLKYATVELSDATIEELKQYALPSYIFLRDLAGNRVCTPDGSPVMDLRAVDYFKRMNSK